MNVFRTKLKLLLTIELFCFFVWNFVAYPGFSEAIYRKILQKLCDPHFTSMTRSATTFEFLWRLNSIFSGIRGRKNVVNVSTKAS